MIVLIAKHFTQIVTVNRGRGLGGSSNLNYIGYARGNPKDYDNWANLTGDPSWNYENLLRCFRDIEDYHGAYQPPDPCVTPTHCH
jgi:choline dehydrogenase-like flavoprotein